MKHPCLLLLFTLLAASSTHAQSVLSWNGSGGPCGFGILQLINLPGELLAITTQKIYASSDGGATWSYRGAIDVPRLVLYGYAISPTGEILVGGHGNPTGAVLFRSADRGRTWQPLSLPGNSGATVAVAPNGTIFAGGPNGPMYRSTDNGTTWQETPVSQTLDGAIAVLPDGSIFVGGTVKTQRGFYRSTNNGNSWFPMPPSNPLRRVRNIVVSGDNSVEVAMSYRGQIIMAQSKDGGTNWTEETLPEHVTQIESMIAIPSERTLYVGTNTGKVLRRNVSSGQWEQVGAEMPGTDIDALVFDNEQQQLVAGLRFGPFRLAYNDAQEEIWTQNCGMIYELGTTSLALSRAGGLLAATAGVAIYRSSPAGDNWQFEAAGSSAITGLAEAADGSIIFGTMIGGLYRSVPGEDTVRRIDQGFTTTNIVAVAIGSGNEILASTPDGGLYTSTDNGNTWDSIPVSGVVAAMVPRGDDIYMATTAGLFRRRSGESSLIPIDVEPGPESFYTLSIAPGGNMVVGGGQEAWLSKDLGETWTRLSQTDLDHYIISIAVDDEARVYAVLKHAAAQRYGRVYFTSTAQTEWKHADLVSDSLAAYALAITPDGTLYTSSATQVFRAGAPASVPSGHQHAALRPALDITPMPASTSAEIRFTLGSAGETTLILSDQNGREIVRQALGNREKGGHAVEIDIALLPPGIYSCEIRRGETRIGSILRVVR